MPGMRLYSVARMFVQTTKCKHGKATYLTYLVRESFRTPKGPRSRTICNITALARSHPRSHRPIVARPELRRHRPSGLDGRLELRRAGCLAPPLGRAGTRPAFQPAGFGPPGRFAAGHDLWPHSLSQCQAGFGRSRPGHAPGQRLRLGSGQRRISTRTTCMPRWMS